MDKETIISEAASSVVLNRVNDDSILMKLVCLSFAVFVRVPNKIPAWEIQIYKYSYDGNRLSGKTCNVGSIQMEYPVTFGEQFNLTYKLNIKN